MQPPAENLEERVFEYIDKHKLVEPGTKIVVAVSGGPDSVALLHILVKLQTNLDVSLVVAHLDHNLRGAESAVDSEFVAGIALRLGLPFSAASRNVGNYKATNRLTLEEAARIVRYEFLSAVARQYGASAVATGHNRDDNIETMLMHVIRGSGTTGLKGLPVKTSWRSQGAQIPVIRPLLDISRREIETYCHRNNLQTVYDSTNQSLAPLRNRIRLELIPLLKKYNPSIDKALLALRAIAGDELDFLGRERDRVWHELVHTEKELLVFDKQKLADLHPALIRSILRRAVSETAGSLKDISSVHIEDMLGIALGPAGRQITLPRGLLFVAGYTQLLLGQNPGKLCPYPQISGKTRLDVPGEKVIGGWRVKADIQPEMAVGGQEHNVAFLDFEKTGDRLFIRPRKPGDRFVPLGMTGQKKLKDFFTDEHIPGTWRSSIPIIENDSQIIWVAPLRIDDRVKVRPDTGEVLRIELLPVERS